MEQKLRILHLEDEPHDSELVSALLKREGLAVEIDRVDEMSTLLEALERGGYALILSDYTIPGLDTREALQLAHARRPEVPFVFVSGTLGEETAIEALQQGATDYVLKQRMNRLGPAVRRALREAEEQARRKRAEAQLQRSQEDLRQVQALNEANLAQLRAVIGSMTEGLAVFDPAGNLLDINPAGLALHGFATVEAMRHHLSELRQIFELRDLTGNLLPAEQWPIARALRGETFTGYQVHVRRLDGRREWFASYGGAPVRDAQGKMLLGIVTLHDITELRRAETALAGRIEQQEILSKALADLLSAGDPKELVRDLFPRVAAHLGVDTYFNFMVNERGEALYLNAYGGVSEETARRIHRLEFGQAICGTVAQTREPLVITDVQNCGDERTTLIRSLGIHSYVCFPLSTGGQLLGTVSFASHTRPHFDQDKLEFLRLFSSYAAVALDRARTLQALRQDIADRQRAEEALRQSEERHRVTAEELQAIMDATPVGLLVAHDPECHLITGNGPAHEILGVPLEENISATPGPQEASPYFRVYRHGHQAEGVKLPMQVAGATGRVVHDEELEVVRRDGTRRTMLVTAAPLYASDGRIRGAVGAVVDVTARKQAEATLRRAEQQFRALAESIPQLVWTADAQGQVDYFNERWCAYTGLTLEQSTSGWFGVVHPDDRAGTFERWTTALSTGQPYETQYRLRSHDGQYRWFLGRGVPLRDSRGAIERWFGTCTDIDEHKRTLQALQESQRTLAQAKDELARTNRDLDRMVRERTAKLQETIAELEQMSYSMIHDLRAPLRAIQSFGGIVAEDPANRLTEESRELIGKMISASDRMDHLVRDVLNYGRVVREELPLAPVDVEALARGIVETYPNLHSSRAEVRVASGLPMVTGNAAALTQCLSQLLDNAVKFARPGQPPKIHVKGELRDNGWVRIGVEDNGLGIAPELRQKVFGMFQQLRNSDEGTGMGLAIVKKAVERMGGHVGWSLYPDKEAGFGLTSERQPSRFLRAPTLFRNKVRERSWCSQPECQRSPPAMTSSPP